MLKICEKYIVSACKCIAVFATLLIGAFCVAVPVQAQADIVLQAVVQGAAISFDVNAPIDNQRGGNTYKVAFTGNNVSAVDIFLDGNVLPFTTIGVDEDGNFANEGFGSIVLPYGITVGSHELKFVAHAKNGNLSAITVIRNIEVSPDAPSVSGVTPNPVPTAGGTTVQITGDNFDNATEVLIDGKPCQEFTVVNNTTISCKVPSHKSGNVSISITTPEGTYTMAADFRGALRYEDGFLPGVPSTGLFVFGDMIVTNYDVMMLSAVFLILGVAILLIVISTKKRPSRQRATTNTKRKSTAKRRTLTKQSASKR